MSQTDTNPYAVTFEDIGPTPEQLNYVRNIDAICRLYVFMGATFVVFGIIGWMSGGDKLICTLAILSGLFAAVSSGALLFRRKRDVPFCRITAVVYLLYFPLGTLLGVYFLWNVSKVRHLLS